MKPRSGVALLACVLALFIAWFGYADHQALYGFYPTRPIFGRDFYGSYLVEAAMLRDGAYGSIWNEAANKAWQTQHGWLNIFNDCPYPPLMALTWVPATYLSLYEAVTTWLQVQVLLAPALGAGLAWFAAAGMEWRRRLCFALLVTPGLFYSGPAMDRFLSGQATLLVTSVTALFALCYCYDKRWPAAVFLGLAINLKVYPVIFLLLPLARRDFAGIARTLACCLLWTLPVLLYCGLPAFSIYWKYLTGVLPGLISTPSYTVSDQSLKGVLPRYLGGMGGLLSLPLGIAVMAASVWALRRRPETLLSSRAFGVALISLVQLTCIGRSWPNYHVALWLTLCMAARANVSLRALTAMLFLYCWQAVADGEVTQTTIGIEFRYWVMESGLTLAVNLALWGCTDFAGWQQTELAKECLIPL